MAKKQKRNRILVLLDETGSMLSVKQATMSGFDEYVQTTKASMPKATLTLVKFNATRTVTQFRDTPIADVAPLSDYAPANGTPLYDAIAAAIREQEQAVKADESVLFVIITDGEENASKEWDRTQIKALIEGKESAGWGFVYIGAVPDAWEVAKSIGVAAASAASYDAADPGEAFRVANTATRNYAGGQSLRNLLDKDKQ